ncbi:hypothetical protein ACIPYQ_09130 [Streptomyces sp. NPDC090045]|uniref:hypothetical protein n=1 Tax=Streptomyces sp. NPDC090045 TaxID=3365927 RepID=UPI003817432D
MTENLIAAVSALVALVGLVLTYRGYRDKQQRDRRAHASMIDVQAMVQRSLLHDGYEVPRVGVTNQSNQPIQELLVRYRDDIVADTLALTGKQIWHLPPSESTRSPDRILSHVTIEFTDAEGTRWRREGNGRLRRGRQTKAGTWKWGTPEPPLITAAAPPPEPQPLPPRRPATPSEELPQQQPYAVYPAVWTSPKTRLRRVPPAVAGAVSVVLLVAAVLILTR